MINRHRILALLLTALVISQVEAALQTVPVEEIKPMAAHRRETRLITHFLANYHYKKTKLDDNLSEKILARYLESMDPTKSYFLRSDIEQFNEHKTRIDDYLRNSDIQPVFDMFVRLRERVVGRAKYAVSLLDTDFDFTRDESFVFDRKDAEWAADTGELNELWRKRVKNDALALRIAGKAVTKIKETLTKRYEGLARRTEQINSEDVFQMFINAYTTSIDPHTAYFSPRTSENFKIRMSLSLEGIGAVLQSDNEYTLVREVVPGGPADLSGKLHADDRIIGIGQGDTGPIVDVIGWRLDDVVDLIRGPKDSIVQLELLPKGVAPNGPGKTIRLTRNKIELKEQAAKKSVIEIPDEIRAMRIGVIDVPTFYMDFDARARGDADYRSTTRDVRKLLRELGNENIDGLIIDLRANGGGSLTEATELTGLFIDTGPVVQVKNSQGRVALERDTDRGLAYQGPLAVLVDGYSASASEIFAGAIQDYHRGIVIGEPTFGKGTVQNLVDLNRFDQTMEGKLGQLKATIAQFFRVEGSSTQNRGVVPDIAFPTAAHTDKQGERGLENALPWARIDAADFHPVVSRIGPFDTIRALHENRTRNDPAFQALLDQEKAIEDGRNKHEVSLLESKRRTDYDTQKQEQRKRENQIRLVRGLPPLPDEPEDGSAAAGGDDEGNDDLDVDLGLDVEGHTDGDGDFDIVLEEASRILRDLIQTVEPTSHLVGLQHPGNQQVDRIPANGAARMD